MLKKLLIGLAILAGFAGPVQSAGTIPFSLQTQFDNLGKVVPNCKLYVIQAGTVATPQNAYFDTALTLPQTNPIRCDAFGRLPQFFLADGSIKVRLTYSNDTNILSADNILVIGPSGGGGGGGGGVDPTTILQTGDIKSVYGTGAISGFVRANAKTIGSATSGGTERANADCQALFVFFWNTDSSLPVSGGRGGSAAADWAANKTITLPDFRGRVLAGFDDMGNSFASRLTGATMTGLGIGSVSSIGESNNILLANLPPYTPSGSLTSMSFTSGTLNSGTLNSGTIVGGSASVTTNNWVASNSGDSTPFNVGGSGGGITIGVASGGVVSKAISTGSVSGSVTGTVSGTVSGTVGGSFTGDAQGGSGIPLKIVQPTILVTHYFKL